MEPDEQQVVLYDFLYRDAGRIASYYAQIFSGRLASLEETDAEGSSVDKGAGVNIPVASGSLKHTRLVQTSSKRVIDPHDVITTDVLSFLQNNNHVSGDVTKASHGSLVLAQGTLVFVDRGSRTKPTSRV